uniref:Uncharacterized protein n=1 Tax=Steinernema glaseri TaxID=37863 RepID=A0A1I8AHI4_9BILA
MNSQNASKILATPTSAPTTPHASVAAK